MAECLAHANVVFVEANPMFNSKCCIIVMRLENSTKISVREPKILYTYFFFKNNIFLLGI